MKNVGDEKVSLIDVTETISSACNMANYSSITHIIKVTTYAEISY